MQRAFSRVSRMPVRTWRWLGVNDVDVVLCGSDHEAAFETPDQVPDRIELRRDLKGVAIPEDATGLFTPEEVRKFLNEQDSDRYYIRIPKDHAENGPVILEFRLSEENSVLADDVVIEAEEGASATIILRYTSDNGEAAHHSGRIRVLAHRNANLTLVKVQMLGAEAAHADVIGCIIEEGAFLNAIIAELGAANPISSCNVVLRGKGSGVDLDILYLGDGTRSLDMSCRVEHRAKESISNIHARGILAGHSKKVFRDTLDFVSGASGSKGREEESVLMFGPGVRNISVPLLLAGEDDIEGEHAASSGRPEDGVMFYLMSRGISELDAKKILAQAIFSSVVEKIPDASTRDDILARVSSSISQGRAP